MGFVQLLGPLEQKWASAKLRMNHLRSTEVERRNTLPPREASASLIPMLPTSFATSRTNRQLTH
jgi:hypothetical protein